MRARSPSGADSPPLNASRNARKRAKTDDSSGRARKRTRHTTEDVGSPAYSPGDTPGTTTTTAAPTPAPTKRDDDDDNEEEDEDEEVYGQAEQEERAEAKLKEQAIGELLKFFTPEQMDRFGTHSRCNLEKKNVRGLVNYVLGQSVTPNIVTSIRGMAKVFVGEMVEAARSVQAERGGSGALAPEDIREGYRRWTAQRDARGSERRKLFTV